MLRSIFFQSEKCYGQFDAKSLHEKKFTITAQLWTKWWLSENGCSKNANLTSVQGHVRPHFAASWWKVLGAFFGKTAFSQVIFYSILCQKWMYQAKLKICFGLGRESLPLTASRFETQRSQAKFRANKSVLPFLIGLLMRSDLFFGFN